MVSTVETGKQHPQRAGLSKPALRGAFHNGTDGKGAFTHKKNMQCFQPHAFIGAVSVDLHQRQHCPNTQLVTPLLPCWGTCWVLAMALFSKFSTPETF